ncbi:MAG: 50S ribosomal protein L22 [Candidatus Norongarragalinales archaeon]
MSIYRYSVKLKQEEAKKTASAQFHDADASYKDLTQVCATIRGKKIDEAFRILDEAIALRRAIPYRKFAKGVGHRSELGGRKGRYPRKECKLVKELLRNAVANASHKGLDEKRLVVRHAAAFKQNSFPRYRRFWASPATVGYGRRPVWSNYETARAEIILEEREASEGKKKEKNKREKKKEKRSLEKNWEKEKSRVEVKA